MIVATDIQLHKKSRVLSIRFEDGKHFDLPCQYLRVFSPAADVKSATAPLQGKENVNITAIEPQGNYGVRLVFDDGHNTGIYSWETLYRLGKRYQENWQTYLDQLKAKGISDQNQREVKQKEMEVKLLYFAWMAQKIGKEEDIIRVPSQFNTVEKLLQFLKKHYVGRGRYFSTEHLTVTVNKEFSEDFTSIEAGDEIAFTPTNPIPPAID